MGSERCYVWSSTSCPSASTTSSLVSADDVSDQMVKIELEAAEALADLAHLAMRESGACNSGGKWGSKGKRAKKRVKSESPPADSPFNSLPSSSDLAQDRARVSLRKCEKICSNVLTEPEKDERDPRKRKVKADQDSELSKLSPKCDISYSSYGFRKSKRNLTEAEKEERKIRRVLANRESARQTIRRRQALCDELSRKAADLALENENLKREKELALKEFQSLEITNKRLKEQMAEVEETLGEHKSSDVAASTSSSTNCPLLLYDHPPFFPVFWPSVIQSSNPVQSQHGQQSAVMIPSNVPMPGTCRPDTSEEQENLRNVNGPRTPLYMLPCPWFFPLPEHGNGLQPQPSFGMKNKQEETSNNNQYSASSSSNTVAHVEDHHCSSPIKIKTEASGATEAGSVDDLNETPVGFPPDGGGRHTGAHPNEIFLIPASLNSVQPASTVKRENKLSSDYTPNTETPSTACHIRSALPEKNQESVIYPRKKLVDAAAAAEARKRRKELLKPSALPEKNQQSVIYPNKKLVDAAAAAEARKRRKELTKLKNLHGRQCQMHC